MSEHKIIPIKYYLGVFSALVLLTIITVYTAKFVDLGSLNFVLAMFIALVKVTLVGSIFMGLLWEKNLFPLIFLAFSFIIFALFVSVSVLDTSSRSSLYAIESIYNRNDSRTPIKIDREGLLSENDGKIFRPRSEIIELKEQIQRDGIEAVLKEIQEKKEAQNKEAPE